MQHSKIISREDGSFVQIEASVYVDMFQPDASYTTCVSYKAPGKRKWARAVEGKATPQEIHDTKLELWHLLKPQK